MLSTVSVTSGRILPTKKSKLSSLIGMTIFNNGLEFIIREVDTIREMLISAINVSRDYNLPRGETV